ncbi:MAG: SET domain-containing protein-lysine N-methyltransferase [Parachlamydiales bacterium]|nr:SET domain-containing protein-lysine N-methyltransferase [Parachlamydiales bacterium]
MFHLAVLCNAFELASQLHKKYPSLNNIQNSYGHTPLDLIKILHKEPCFSFLFQEEKPIKLRYKDQYHEYSSSEFYKSMGIKYVPYLIFEEYEYFQKIYGKCQRALKKTMIDASQKWYGMYYEKELMNGDRPDVLIQWIDPVVRFGLFANEDLEPDTYVGEYGGMIRKRTRSVINKNDYCFEYLIGNEETTPFTIDARQIGNHTRFINHSDQPNLTPVAVFSQGYMHVVLRANRYIQKGTELTYNYGPNYWKKREKPIRR